MLYLLGYEHPVFILAFRARSGHRNQEFSQRCVFRAFHGVHWFRYPLRGRHRRFLASRCGELMPQIRSERYQDRSQMVHPRVFQCYHGLVLCL